MDAAADWPTRIEELRFDPQDVSDPTWHRCEDVYVCVCVVSMSLSSVAMQVNNVWVWGTGGGERVN